MNVHNVYYIMHYPTPMTELSKLFYEYINERCGNCLDRLSNNDLTALGDLISIFVHDIDQIMNEFMNWLKKRGIEVEKDNDRLVIEIISNTLEKPQPQAKKLNEIISERPVFITNVQKPSKSSQKEKR